MRYRSIPILVLILNLALGCASAAQDQLQQVVTFIHFNDLHAHLVPHKDLVRDPATKVTRIEERGGLARAATLIQRIRSDNPASVLMNIGDTYHGGAEAMFTNGNAIVDPVNALGIDVGVPGNWDYAYGPLVTQLRYGSLNVLERIVLAGIAGVAMSSGPVKRPGFPSLAANVTYTKPFYRAGDPFLEATLIKEIGGIRVGFVGLSSDIVPRMSEAMAWGLDFVQGEAAYRALVERHATALRQQGAAIVVVMSELGIHKDYQLAQGLPRGLVDVFFSAHTHEATYQPLVTASGTLVVEAGNDGTIGRMDIAVRDGRVSGHRWQLLPVDAKLPEDSRVAALVAQARAPFLTAKVNMEVPMPFVHQHLDQSIATVVGHVDGLLHRRNALENPFNDAFTEALRRHADTQVAITPGFRFDSVVGASYEDSAVAGGDVTLEDLYRFFPAPYALASGEISGQALTSMLEEQLTAVFSTDAFKQSGGWLEGYAGLKVTLNLHGPDGQRVREAHLTGVPAPLADLARITVAGCQRPDDDKHTLCSQSGFNQLHPLIDARTGKAWTPVDFTAWALRKGLLIAPNTPRLQDLDKLPLWPKTPFVQPLNP